MSTTTTTAFEASTRVSYHDGILLGAEDFQRDQNYHREQLAAALLRLHGFGTIAGLKVEEPGEVPAADRNQPDATDVLVVKAGIAIDPRGRLIEVPKDYCLRLHKWVTAFAAKLPGGFNWFADGAERYLVADVFLRYYEKPSGLRPGFPEPDTDATDAVVPARASDRFELALVPRDCEDRTELPELPAARFEVKPANYRKLLESIYGSYVAATPIDAAVEASSPPDIFLSRVLIRLKDEPATDWSRHDDWTVEVRDEGRPLVLPADMLATLLPMPA